MRPAAEKMPHPTRDAGLTGGGHHMFSLSRTLDAPPPPPPPPPGPAPPSAHELEETRQASQTVAISRCATGPRVHKVVERAGLLALL